MKKLLEMSLEEVRRYLENGGSLVASTEDSTHEARRCPGFEEEVYVVVRHQYGLATVAGCAGLSNLPQTLGQQGAELALWKTKTETG